MPDVIEVRVNGRQLSVRQGSTVAAAIAIAGAACRKSVTGEPRTILCAMGICFECRAEVNGTPHTRTCQTPCEQDMDIRTDA